MKEMKVKDLVMFMSPFDEVMISPSDNLFSKSLYNGLVSSLDSNYLDLNVIGILSFNTGCLIGFKFGILVSDSDRNE